MAENEIHLELLLGKEVRDATGKAVGRIEEVGAERRGDECFVREYFIGAAALRQRLLAGRIKLPLTPFSTNPKSYSGYRVAWDKMDLSDPNNPRLLCSISELEK